MKRQLGMAVMMAVVAAAPLLPGCDRGAKAPPTAPVAEVSVVTVQPQRLVLTTELPGRTASYRVSEVRPQVSGLIQKRLFTEGADVKAGDLLYQIDPAPFEATVASGKANLLAAQKNAERAKAALVASEAAIARQQALVKLAKTNGQRFEELFAEKAVSASQRDQAVTDLEVATASLRAAEAQLESERAAVAASDAAIKQAEAALQTSNISLGYTRITAPIAGRIGRSAVTEGATVTAYQAAPLATIQSLDPIYVDVPQSTMDLGRLKQSIAAGKLQAAGADEQAVKIILEDGTTYPLPGVLKFREVTVDPTTGSVMLRVEVPNPNAVLLPGMFVRAAIEEGVNEKALLVPQNAVTRGPKGDAQTLVLGADGIVQARMLTTDRAVGSNWLVSAGLAPGDRVITAGVQRLRPGMPAKLSERKPAGSPTTQTASAR